jgi:hypothetical protein
MGDPLDPLAPGWRPGYQPGSYWRPWMEEDEMPKQSCCCGQCGAIVEETHLYCWNCGERVEDPIVADEEMVPQDAPRMTGKEDLHTCVCCCERVLLTTFCTNCGARLQN